MESKPIVVMATHERIAITTPNIELLIKQGAFVVLVVSKESELVWYNEIFQNKPVAIVQWPNSPLGAKWQAGVTYARTLPHTHIIITGSDDILSKQFVQLCTESAWDIVGIYEWYIFNPLLNELHHFRYKANQPLGGGRCYNKKFLEDIDYRLFDTGASKWLDDQGWAKTDGYRIAVSQGPMILAVKGDWPVMNPLEKTFGHKNAEHLFSWQGQEALDIIFERFNYKP